MKESDFQTIFGKWLRKGKLDAFGAKASSSCAFELKLVKKGENLRLTDVKEHQVDGLLRANDPKKGLYLKLTDMSLGTKPFDCFYLRGAEAFVVVAWYEKGKGIKGAYFMPVVTWDAIVRVRAKDTRKVMRSLSEERFEALGGVWHALL